MRVLWKFFKCPILTIFFDKLMGKSFPASRIVFRPIIHFDKQIGREYLLRQKWFEKRPEHALEFFAMIFRHR